MRDSQFLTEGFEQNRNHLRAVAYRMLGSLSEADDAVQEAWLRLNRASDTHIDNLGGWLTTVVARVCLDLLRSRTSRREESLEEHLPEPPAPKKSSTNPEQEALLADSVGLALLVVLDRLTPPERLAFVLHDMFDLPFDEIGAIVGRTPTAARQLASRARHRVRGGAPNASVDLPQQRRVADAFLAALRSGDFNALVAVLDPDIVIRTDRAAILPGVPEEVRGAENWARQALKAAKGAKAASVALVDGAVGIVVAPRGRLFRVLRFTIHNSKISRIDVIGDPAQLAKFDVALFDE